MVYYPKPIPFQKAYDFMGVKEGDFPVSEGVAKRIFSLPMHAYLGDDEVDEISENINFAINSI